MFRHFEAAEWEFYRALGFPLGRGDDGPVAYPRVHVECDFLAALACDDEIEIAVSVERVGGSSYSLVFETFFESRVAARGKIVAVAMNRQTAQACPLPAEFAEALRGKLA
jgi:acyl-CoA thioesterase FadM